MDQAGFVSVGMKGVEKSRDNIDRCQFLGERLLIVAEQDSVWPVFFERTPSSGLGIARDNAAGAIECPDSVHAFFDGVSREALFESEDHLRMCNHDDECFTAFSSFGQEKSVSLMETVENAEYHAYLDFLRSFEHIDILL